MTYSHFVRAGVLLLISMVSAFLFAATFVLISHLTLPPSDLAYGQPISEVFSDPLVIDVAGFVAFCSGLLMFPASYFFLRKRRLLLCVPIVTTAVLAEITLFTAGVGILGWLASYPTLLAALAICWAAGPKIAAQGHVCHGCGYDLRGATSSRCPECDGQQA